MGSALLQAAEVYVMSGLPGIAEPSCTSRVPRRKPQRDMPKQQGRLGPCEGRIRSGFDSESRSQALVGSEGVGKFVIC